MLESLNNSSFQQQISDISKGVSGGFQNYGKMGDTGKLKFAGKVNYLIIGMIIFGFIFIIKKGKK